MNTFLTNFLLQGAEYSIDVFSLNWNIATLLSFMSTFKLKTLQYLPWLLLNNVQCQLKITKNEMKYFFKNWAI